jgi:selenide,water dikinase
MSFDLCSFNLGSKTIPIPVDDISRLVSIKPFTAFLQRWLEFEARVVVQPGTLRAAVIGGGAAAIEVALAVQSFFVGVGKISKTKNATKPADEVHLFFPAALPAESLRADLIGQGIHCHSNSLVERVEANRLFLKCGETRTLTEDKFDLIVNCAGASSPFEAEAFPTGFLSEKGFLKVNANLSLPERADVFAVGDCAEFLPERLTKSGVHAVRQGKVLARNLEILITGQGSLNSYQPPRHPLAILRTGSQTARIVWGTITFAGRTAFQLKRWIDERYVRRYQRPERVTGIK